MPNTNYAQDCSRKDVRLVNFLTFEGFLIAWAWPVDLSGETHCVSWFIAQVFDGGLARQGASFLPPLESDRLPLDQWPEAEFIAEGFLKWDQCSQWECNVHFDSPEERRSFFGAVDIAHQRAAKYMGEVFDGEADKA